MRVLFYLLAVVSLLAGILFGALNSEHALVDLYFIQIDLSLGVALLVAMLLGAVFAWILLAMGVILPLKRRMAKQRNQLRKQAESTNQAAATLPESAAA